MVRTTPGATTARAALALLLTSASALAGSTTASASDARASGTPASGTRAAGTRAADTRAPYPVPYSLVGGFFADPAAGLNPSAAPPGANDWTCKPTAAHPEPVVLLHGLGGNQRLNWSTMAPLLANNGYCVYSLTYGNHGTLPVGGLESMRGSARKVSDLVDKVLRQTGARKVKLVGHSEGSTVAAYYLKKLGGARKADTLVGISPNYRGTELYGLTKLANSLPPGLDDVLEKGCKACKEFSPDSAFTRDLNSGGTAAVPGVRYTNVQGAVEEVVVPNSSGTLRVPNAVNLRVNKGCPSDLSDHVSLVASRRMSQITLNALDPAHPHKLPCAFNPPFLN
ncbi:alpha/beta fold hydrolase [Streptomyces sp. ODS28]|uniref:esterase/lipase family protein n=1 Tax=Streptomyces sp. ODS28 TaxID=3136688 RepID=UPI0031F0280A